MLGTLPLSHTTGFAVLALSSTEWRISDPSRRADDAHSLVGFVQREKNKYEVTAISRPERRHYSQSFDEALQYLARVPRM
jgi:hypothetical protein